MARKQTTQRAPAVKKSPAKTTKAKAKVTKPVPAQRGRRPKVQQASATAPKAPRRTRQAKATEAAPKTRKARAKSPTQRYVVRIPALGDVAWAGPTPPTPGQAIAFEGRAYVLTRMLECYDLTQDGYAIAPTYQVDVILRDITAELLTDAPHEGQLTHELASLRDPAQPAPRNRDIQADNNEDDPDTDNDDEDEEVPSPMMT